MEKLKQILDAYRNKEREFPSYGELMALALEPVAAPEGWKLVPVEPTEEMVEESRGFLPVGARHHGPNVYAAMIAVAPSPAPAAEKAV